MDVELDPEQADEVVRVVRALLDREVDTVDPWWLAGIDEALSAADCEPGLELAQGEATAPPRRTPGAERA